MSSRRLELLTSLTLQPDSQCHLLEHTVLHRMKQLYTNLHLAHSRIGRNWSLLERAMLFCFPPHPVLARKTDELLWFNFYQT